MRIGTWNLAGRWSPEHAGLLQRQECDLWLLTEVPDRLSLDGWTVHRTQAEMSPGRAWAAVAAPVLQPQPDPHPASAAALVDGRYVCSTVLPWRACGTEPPWRGPLHADKVGAVMLDLRAAWPGGELVWGGDWNTALDGPERAGSRKGRAHVLSAVDDHGLQVPTADLPHRLDGCLSTAHVAVPHAWAVRSALRVDATGLSDHDAYVVEAEPAQSGT